MFPQRPDHIPQDLWELELPSILGLAHPRLSADDEDSGDDKATGVKDVHDVGVMGASNSAASRSSQSFILDSLGPQPASAYSPANWSDLWNMPDESAALTLSFALGDALGATIRDRLNIGSLGLRHLSAGLLHARSADPALQ